MDERRAIHLAVEQRATGRRRRSQRLETQPSAALKRAQTPRLVSTRVPKHASLSTAQSSAGRRCYAIAWLPVHTRCCSSKTRRQPFEIHLPSMSVRGRSWSVSMGDENSKAEQNSARPGFTVDAIRRIWPKRNRNQNRRGHPNRCPTPEQPRRHPLWAPFFG